LHIKADHLRNILLPVALGAAGLYAFLRWLLPWLLPFFIAWGIAALLEPAVVRLCRKGVRRGVAACVCLLIAFAVLGILLWMLLSRLMAELSGLLVRLPEILTGISDTLRNWEVALASYLDKTPEGLRQWTDRALDSVVSSLTTLPGKLSAHVLRIVPAVASSAPAVLLFAVTVVIGTFFISSSYPDLLHGAARHLPEQFLCRARLMRRDLRRTLGRWFRAQLIMLLITFAALTAAFLLLRVDYALLLALVTALIDALPVLGTGTVLLPWTLYAFLTGQIPLGVGLAITYAGVTVLHQSIQAKLLGDQLGLHPLAMLLAIYLGFRICGVWGMLGFPILAVSLKQIVGSGVFRNGTRVTEYEGG